MTTAGAPPLPSPSRLVPKDRASSALFLLFSAIFLGHALQLGNGTIYNSPDPIPLNSTIGWLTASFIACALAVFLPRLQSLEDFARRNFFLFAAVGLTWQFYSQLTTSPGSYIEVNVFRALQTYIACITILFAAVMASLGRSISHRLTVPIILLAFTFAGVWLLRVDAHPNVDVHIFGRDSTNALLHGQNPYSITFPDIYGKSADIARRAYGPGVAAQGRTLFGYPYLPLTLILCTAAEATYGDYRLAQVLALSAAAGLMFLCRRNRYGVCAAAILLLTPRVFFVLEQGYVDPFAILFFAATIWAACRAPRSLDWIYGLFLVSKQYIFITLPLALLLRATRQSRLRLAIISILVAGAISLPFLIWGPRNFLYSTVLLQFRQPFRDDSLSYLAWFSHRFHVILPSITGFLAAAIAAAFVCWRTPRTAAGIATGIAFEFFAFFAFNKQAFANYYLLVIGAMCCAIAAASDVSSDESHHELA